MKRLSVLVAASLCLLGGSASATGRASTFTDPASDSGAAPDVTSVVVSNDAKGQIAFRIDHHNQPDLAQGTRIAVLLDLDRNPSTGARAQRGSEYYLGMSGSSRTAFLMRWNGVTFNRQPTKLQWVFERGYAQVTINRSELGETRGFDFHLHASEGPDLYSPTAADDAPDTGSWSYQLTGTQPASLSELVQRVRDGVIRIAVDGCAGRTIGSGFLVGPRQVATVEHVVSEARRIVLERSGKRLGTARIVGHDRKRDLALLQTTRLLTGHRFSLDARAPRVGDAVAVLGYPVGLPLTVTRGSVSGLNRSISIEGVTRRGLVQTDAAVNRGNSGGPLLAIETGALLGLVDIGSTQVRGIAFAVSVQVAKPLLSAWKASPQPSRPASC